MKLNWNIPVSRWFLILNYSCEVINTHNVNSPKLHVGLLQQVVSRSRCEIRWTSTWRSGRIRRWYIKPYCCNSLVEPRLGLNSNVELMGSVSKSSTSECPRGDEALWHGYRQHNIPSLRCIISTQHKWKSRKSWFRWKIKCVQIQIGVILLFGILGSGLSFATSHNCGCIVRMNDEVPRLCTSRVIGAPLRQPFSLDTAQEHKLQQRGSNTS